MVTLTERLKTLADFIATGERVADIGTDHALLPIYLRQSGISPFCIASDIREKPLKSALKNIQKYGVTDIEAHLCDGLFGLSKNEVDAIVIAGMGGECIAEILDKCDWIKDSGKHLILQPMNSPEVLRAYLRINGYTLLSEKAVFCTGRYYTVMNVTATPQSEYPEWFDYLGKLDCRNTADVNYLKKQFARINDCAVMLKNIPAKKDEYTEYRKIADAINDYISCIKE